MAAICQRATERLQQHEDENVHSPENSLIKKVEKSLTLSSHGSTPPNSCSRSVSSVSPTTSTTRNQEEYATSNIVSRNEEPCSRSPSPAVHDSRAQTTPKRPQHAPDLTPLQRVDANDTASPSPNNPRNQLRKKFARKLHRVNNLQKNVLGKRIEAGQLLDNLRRERESLADLGAELMQSLNEVFVQANRDAIELPLNLFDQYQQTRDSYQDLEDGYREYEMELVAEEHELLDAEKELGNISQRLWDDDYSTPKFDDQTAAGDGAATSISSKHSTASDPSVLSENPLMVAYLSSVGDTGILKERLWDIRSERDGLLAEQASRQRFGLVLDAESQHFLEQFDQTEKELLDQIVKAEANVQYLKMQCAEQGLLDLSDDSNHHLETEDEILDHGGAASDRALLLLWAEKSPVLFEESSIPYHESVDIAAHINKWLLHKLCASSIEIRLLKSLPELEALALQMDPQTFRDLVIRWWTKDKAAARPVVHPQSRDDDSIQMQVDHDIEAKVPSFEAGETGEQDLNGWGYSRGNELDLERCTL